MPFYVAQDETTLTAEVGNEGIFKQVISTVTNAAERDASIIAPKKGQHCYLESTDQTLRWSGTEWVELIPAKIGGLVQKPLRVCTSTTRPAHSAGQVIFETDTLFRLISTGSEWQHIGASPWSVTVKSDSSYNAAITGAWADMPGLVQTAYIPNKRTLEVEFKAGILRATNGYSHLRLVVNGEIVDAITAGGTDTWVPARLTGGQVGTGATITYKVQGNLQSGTGDLRAQQEGAVIMRHRYI